MSYEGHQPLNHTFKPIGCRMWFIALVISESCAHFSTALCGRMISEVETMWKETDVAGFRISSVCDIVLILPQNTYTKACTDTRG